MSNKVFKISILIFFSFLLLSNAIAVNKTATIRINKDVKYQKITGYGGFVNSPQFGYNHMSTTEIRKMWGKNSEAGYNIMRLYLPENENNWNITLETAKLAKSLGVIIFASPWTMPASWKTNNNIAAVYTDANGVEQIGYLKEEYYDDYADYLNRYVTYLRNNGVELDAISIQNEPDMKSTYHGCIWTPAQMAKFLKENGSRINCKVIAPEGIGITDNYVNGMLDEAVLANFEIFAGHQYSYIQSGLNKMLEKGKEVWMTEYLINWNANQTTTRNFNWSIDAFDFAGKLNDAMGANVNAWVHYATKRYYGPMGDGTYGTTNGVITKRGYILSHYAKFTTGSTRINNVFSDESKALNGSSYLSSTGDSLILMVINTSSDTYTLTADLPFNTQSGKKVTTSASQNMFSSIINIGDETCRPKVTIDASCVTTLIFTKSSEREVSKMTGEPFHPNKIDNMSTTSTAFGTSYKLSGKTAIFDNSRALFSSNTSAGNGFVKLDDSYNQLVFHINTITSAMSFTSANTTLYYVNNNGTANSYNYGTVSYNSAGNYEWVVDISDKFITDGLTGIIGLRNGNYTSVLTINFKDVFLRTGNEKSYKFSGIYSISDSYLLDCLEDSSYVSLDFSNVSSVTTDQNWYSTSANKNCIYYVSDAVKNNNTNVISGTTCENLVLSQNGGDFFVNKPFTATYATYTRSFNEYGMLTLPFEAGIPAGLNAYTVAFNNTEMECTQITNNKIPANTPVLIKGSGTFTFTGSGNVSTSKSVDANGMKPIFVSSRAPLNSFILKTVNGVTAFYKVTSITEPNEIPFSSYFNPSTSLANISLMLKFGETSLESVLNNDIKSDGKIYDIFGRPVKEVKKGIYIINRKKVSILR